MRPQGSISVALTLLLVFIQIFVNGASIIKQNEGNEKRVQELDDYGKVLMAWVVDDATGVITFEIEAETSGYVGFGISPQGSMTGADIFIAGVNPDGSSYHSDRFGLGFFEPKVDVHSDWKLLEAKEFVGISTITYLKFSRLLNTCDDEDYPITNDTNRLIWALGATDKIEYHSTDRRGARSIHLLGAPIPDFDADETSTWDFMVDMTMQPSHTSYWCTFHKGPALNKKHHAVAFETKLADLNSVKHTHHFVIYNCYNHPSSNQTTDELFGNFTFDKYGGGHCYDDYSEEDNPPPIHYCQEFLYVWSKGGKKMALPEGVGYPIGPEIPVDEALNQYYMLEVHYDNPDELHDVKFKTGAQMFYTDNLRETEAGMLVIMHDTDQSLTIPPDSPDFVVSGHCSPSCSDHFPTDGITIFNSMLHSHLSGRKIKLRHFGRDQEREEHEWLDNDDNYDFDYQQNKQLVNPRRVLQGDHLIVECTYDTRWKNGSVVIGSLSTRDEMCQAFIWYYPRMEIGLCGSTYPLELGMEDFGITKFEKKDVGVGADQIIIQEPTSLAGEYEDSLNTKFNWTDEFKQELQRKRRFDNHEVVCIKMRTGEKVADGEVVTYPNPTEYDPYIPEDFCATQSTTSIPTTSQGGGGSGVDMRSSPVSLTVLVSAYVILNRLV